jgi:hypothetical protein
MCNKPEITAPVSDSVIVTVTVTVTVTVPR